MKVVEGAPVVWGVSATAHAENQAAAVAAAAEEFPRPEIVTETAVAPGPVGPAELLDALPLLPRRRRAAAPPDARRDHAELGVPDPSALGEGPGQPVFVARPDLGVLAQVLQGLRQMG